MGAMRIMTTALCATLTIVSVDALALSPKKVATPRSPLSQEQAVAVVMPTTDNMAAANLLFYKAVMLCEASAAGQKVSLEEVPRKLKEVFEADIAHIHKTYKRASKDIECVRPADGIDGQQLSGAQFQELVTSPGRQCDGGVCTLGCSRVSLSNFASPSECEEIQRRVAALMDDGCGEERAPFETSLNFGDCVHDVQTALLFLRVIERLRRCVADEYDLPLASLKTEFAFVSRICSEAQPESYGIVHADESSYSNYHYSTVLQLGTDGQGFEGGEFVFVGANGLPEERFTSTKGRAMMFTSGWENVHYVDKVRSGTRFAMPVFFTTEACLEGENDKNEWAEELCRIWSSD